MTVYTHPMIPRGIFEDIFDIKRESDVVNAIEIYMKV